MKKIIILLLSAVTILVSKGQMLALQKSKFKDYSLITATHWRQIPVTGLPTVTIANPDSLTTKVLNINRAGTYKFELAVTFIKAGVTTTKRDTVNVIAHPPVKDAVRIVQTFSTGKSIEVVSTVQSTMKIKVFTGSTVTQNYTATAYSGVRYLFVTGLKPGYVISVTLNGKVYNL